MSSVSTPNQVQQSTPQSPTRVRYTTFQSELELPLINALIEKELSEPYIVYTYRYFLNQWPQLCLLAWSTQCDAEDDGDASLQQPGTHAKRGDEAIGVIICKIERHMKGQRKMRGYIAMLSVRPDHRGQGIATQLVTRANKIMSSMGAQEVALETEADNLASLALYERMGFMKEKRLHRFYLNGKDCFRLILPLDESDRQNGNDYGQARTSMGSQALSRIA
ncbi:unnamed protein product [Sympodiomycopsis kandeliae]